MKETIIKLFKPTLYYVERDKFLGDFSNRLAAYKLEGGMVIYTDSTSGLEIALSLNQVFLLEKNAKKEASKTIIPVDNSNLGLVWDLEAKGKKLTNYQRQQIIEDGEASEVYQKLSQ